MHLFIIKHYHTQIWVLCLYVHITITLTIDYLLCCSQRDNMAESMARYLAWRWLPTSCWDWVLLSLSHCLPSSLPVGSRLLLSSSHPLTPPITTPTWHWDWGFTINISYTLPFRPNSKKNPLKNTTWAGVFYSLLQWKGTQQTFGTATCIYNVASTESYMYVHVCSCVHTIKA